MLKVFSDLTRLDRLRPVLRQKLIEQDDVRRERFNLRDLRVERRFGGSNQQPQDERRQRRDEGSRQLDDFFGVRVKLPFRQPRPYHGAQQRAAQYEHQRDS